jgi:MFS family permease
MATASTEECGTAARRRWLIMAAMGGVIGVILLDETVVGVALPKIRHDLGLSQVAEHWVVNAYLLVFACLSAAGGSALPVSGGGFFDVFLASACLTLAVLALTWRYVTRDAPADHAGGGIPVPGMRG